MAQPDARQDFKQRQLAFLNRIRDADPHQRIIDRAMLNEQNELGLIQHNLRFRLRPQIAFDSFKALSVGRC